jgi:hypothetical protein
MNSFGDIAEVAREMLARHGSAALAIVEKYVTELEAAGQSEDASMWSMVATAIRALQR